MSDTSLGPGPEPWDVEHPIPLTDLREQIRLESGLPPIPDPPPPRPAPVKAPPVVAAEDNLPFKLKYDELVVRNRDTGELRVIRDRDYMYGDWEVVRYPERKRQATNST